MKIIHYFKVAFHFYPWERAFWLGLLHDGVEDGWIDGDWLVVKLKSESFPRKFWMEMAALIRDDEETYMDYIRWIQKNSNVLTEAKRVKIADLLVNYKRAKPLSLRNRYAKALLELSKEKEWNN